MKDMSDFAQVTQNNYYPQEFFRCQDLLFICFLSSQGAAFNLNYTYMNGRVATAGKDQPASF